MMTGPHTPEARARISAAMRGNKNSLGRQLSAETRANISASLMGHGASEKARENFRVAHRVIQLFKPELAAALAENNRVRMRERMKDPAFRERIAAGQKAYWERRRAAKAGGCQAEVQAAIDRQREIADMRATGATFKEIGRHFGISMNRAYVLHRKHLSRTQKDVE